MEGAIHCLRKMRSLEKRRLLFGGILFGERCYSLQEMQFANCIVEAA